MKLLKELIQIFTDEGDVVIDPCAGSASTLRACAELGRSCFGFEIDKRFYREAQERMLNFDITGAGVLREQLLIEGM